jgi:hypothetical protein
MLKTAGPIIESYVRLALKAASMQALPDGIGLAIR